jgi:hypothetical protein
VHLIMTSSLDCSQGDILWDHYTCRPSGSSTDPSWELGVVRIRLLFPVAIFHRDIDSPRILALLNLSNCCLFMKSHSIVSIKCMSYRMFVVVSPLLYCRLHLVHVRNFTEEANTIVNGLTSYFSWIDVF